MGGLRTPERIAREHRDLSSRKWRLHLDEVRRGRKVGTATLWSSLGIDWEWIEAYVTVGYFDERRC